MDNAPSTQKGTPEPPAPEVLKPRTAEDDGSSSEPKDGGGKAHAAPPPKAPARRRRAYRPSHKATFIGLTVVALILALNAGIIGFVVKSQSKAKDSLNQGQVTISQGVLDKLGVNRSSIGDSGIQLTIGPNTRFTGKVDIGGDTSVAGQLHVNNQVSAPSASLAKLQAGDTTLSKLNVNGSSTLSQLALRNDLQVAGTTRLQNVTVSGLLTVNNSLNVSGNLGVGGTLAVGTLSAHGLVLSGHMVTAGSTPGVSRGGCIGSNGTVSISGNDQAGTVAVNAGSNSAPCTTSGGILATVTFRTYYGSIPHVVITPVGRGISNFYVSRNAGGFSIGGAPSSFGGGYAFDYIVEQ